MKNLYHKVAVASVCTALGFVLGASEEAKAATITLPTTITFGVRDSSYDGNSFDGLGDEVLPATSPAGVRGTEGEARRFVEFNISSFSQTANISRAIFQAEIFSFEPIGLGLDEPTNPGNLGIFGYVGNGTAEASDFEAGVLLSSVDVSQSSTNALLNLDVTEFVNQRVSNNDAFAGFGIRALNLGGFALGARNFPGGDPRLIVETADVAEPVPEPTTIFGSALALSLGGWLKRKKLSQQNKTAPQR